MTLQSSTVAVTTKKLVVLLGTQCDTPSRSVTPTLAQSTVTCSTDLPSKRNEESDVLCTTPPSIGRPTFDRAQSGGAPARHRSTELQGRRRRQHVHRQLHVLVRGHPAA